MVTTKVLEPIKVEDIYITGHSLDRYIERLAILGKSLANPEGSLKELLRDASLEVSNSKHLDEAKKKRFNKYKKECYFLTNSGWRFILYPTSESELKKGFLPYTLITVERVLPSENKKDTGWLNEQIGVL